MHVGKAETRPVTLLLNGHILLLDVRVRRRVHVSTFNPTEAAQKEARHACMPVRVTVHIHVCVQLAPDHRCHQLVVFTSANATVGRRVPRGGR